MRAGLWYSQLLSDGFHVASMLAPCDHRRWNRRGHFDGIEYGESFDVNLQHSSRTQSAEWGTVSHRS